MDEFQRKLHYLNKHWPRVAMDLDLFFSPPEAGTLIDAIEIADSCARADIECNVPKARDGTHGAHWYDTGQMGPEERDWLPQSLRYLEARGLLLRDAQNPAIVSFKSGEVSA